MTADTPLDGTVIPAVHGPAAAPAASAGGVPAASSPPEAPGLASRAPERDAAGGPRDAGPSPRPGDPAAPGLRGQAARDAIKAALAEQGRRQRAARGRYTRIADRLPGVSYRPGGNRRGGNRQ